jgi:hypothetical protein
MSISSLEQELREFINHPRKQAGLLSDAASWNIICSALDVVGDTELALDAYLNLQPLSTDGEKYLMVYGVLQVMEVQQDAVKFLCDSLLCDSLSVRYSRPKELSDIRTIRSKSIGHPIKSSENRITKSNFIRRSDIGQRSFTLMTVSDKRDYQWRGINIPKLLTTQRLFLEKQLQQIVEKLRSDEMAHREKHKTELLQELFPRTLGYYFGKVYEGAPLAAPHLALIKECLTGFRQALAERGEWRKDSVAAHDMEFAEYSIEELEHFFDPARESKLNDHDVYIFISFLQAQVEKIRDIAKEIDDEYASVA